MTCSHRRSRLHCGGRRCCWDAQRFSIRLPTALGQRTAVPNAIFPRKGTHGVAVETTGGIVIMAIIIAFHLVLWKAEMWSKCCDLQYFLFFCGGGAGPSPLRVDVKCWLWKSFEDLVFHSMPGFVGLIKQCLPSQLERWQVAGLYPTPCPRWL